MILKKRQTEYALESIGIINKIQSKEGKSKVAEKTTTQAENFLSLHNGLSFIWEGNVNVCNSAFRRYVCVEEINLYQIDLCFQDGSKLTPNNGSGFSFLTLGNGYIFEIGSPKS